MSVPIISQLSKLKIIDLSRNKITFTSAHDFDHSIKLESIDLSHNRVVSVLGVFRLSNLFDTNLAGNSLQYFGSVDFLGYTSLERITMDGINLMRERMDFLALSLTEFSLNHI